MQHCVSFIMNHSSLQQRSFLLQLFLNFSVVSNYFCSVHPVVCHSIQLCKVSVDTKIVHASHAFSMYKYMNTKLKLLNCNANNIDLFLTVEIFPESPEIQLCWV
jgi:hypothetical protein